MKLLPPFQYRNLTVYSVEGLMEYLRYYLDREAYLAQEIRMQVSKEYERKISDLKEKITKLQSQESYWLKKFNKLRRGSTKKYRIYTNASGIKILVPNELTELEGYSQIEAMYKDDVEVISNNPKAFTIEDMMEAFDTGKEHEARNSYEDYYSDCTPPIKELFDKYIDTEGMKPNESNEYYINFYKERLNTKDDAK